MTNKPVDIKKNFQVKFRKLLQEEPILHRLMLEIFVYGTAYVVGGYLRDFLNNNSSRDIDIIVDLDNVKLLDIIDDIGISHEKNRHGGVKLHLTKTVVDLWSLENNWAFKNKLVKLNEDDKISSIAKGCFFNYDSLVINLHNYSYNIKYYKDFHYNNKLDILQKSSVYKNLNPTTEANIIRSIFLKLKYDVELTENTVEYITKKFSNIKHQYHDGFQRIIDVKSKYPKYKELKDEILKTELLKIIEQNKQKTDQLSLEI